MIFVNIKTPAQSRGYFFCSIRSLTKVSRPSIILSSLKTEFGFIMNLAMPNWILSFDISAIACRLEAHKIFPAAASWGQFPHRILNGLGLNLHSTSNSLPFNTTGKNSKLNFLYFSLVLYARDRIHIL